MGRRPTTGIPRFDPLDPSMSGDDTDPVLVGQVIDLLYRKLDRRRDAAAPPGAAGALSEVLGALHMARTELNADAGGGHGPRLNTETVEGADHLAVHAGAPGGPEDVRAVLDAVAALAAEVRARYDHAKFGADPVGRRALGVALDAVERVWMRRAKLVFRTG